MAIPKRFIIILFLILLPLALSLNARSAVLINEILANGLSDPDSEWIELFNNGSAAVNLTNWNVSETASGNFTLNGFIPPNGFIILAGDFKTFNSTHPNANSSGIRTINITISSFNLADTSGQVFLYNSSGMLADSMAYAQASGKAFENISIGRYPDGSSTTLNLSTLTPGAKNDNQAPRLNKWLNPSANNTNISGILSVAVNITDDTTQVNSAIINFNSTNFSMSNQGDIWTFLWNTSMNAQKQYNITIFFNDSYGKSGSDALLNIVVNNSPRIISFSPQALTQALAEGSALNFSTNATDPDDALLDYLWLIDGALASTSPVNFSYSPGFGDNGTHEINATIKDASLNQVSMKWGVAVANVNRAPVLSLLPDQTGSKNITLAFNITASDPDNDALAFSSNHSAIAISKINNSLATASWKPINTDLGNNPINFTVSDGYLTDSQIIIIAVNATNNAAPFIVSSPKTNASVNEIYTYDVEGIDFESDVLFYSLKTNASGMSIGNSDGAITFMPSSVGFFGVNVSVTDLIAITNQSYNLTVKEEGGEEIEEESSEEALGLKISDIDAKIDGKTNSNINNNTKISKEAKPESSIEFKVTVKNNFPESSGTKISDIRVKATIREIDNDDDIEDEADEFDLGAQNDKTSTLKFNLPLNVDEGSFDVLIEAEGEDENGSIHAQYFELKLEVDKKKHDLKLTKFELSPQAVNCNRDIIVSYGIINIGQEDEENALLEAKSNELGLIAAENFSLDSGTEDNSISKFTKVRLSNSIESGAYPLEISVKSSDGKTRDTRKAELSVRDCIRVGEAEEPEIVLITRKEGQKETQAIKEPLKTIKTIKSQGVSKEHGNLQLLLVSSFILTMAFLATAIILYLII